MRYRHPRIGEEVEAIGGHYVFTKEAVLEHETGNILYFVGCAVTDRSCCGPGGCGYAVVAGYVVSLSCDDAQGSQPFSDLAPVPETLHEEVARAIKFREGLSQVQFLQEGGRMRVVF